MQLNLNPLVYRSQLSQHGDQHGDITANYNFNIIFLYENVSSLRTGQSDCHFADKTVKCISFNEEVYQNFI